MKTNSYLTFWRRLAWAGFVVVAGCTTYVQEPPRTVYIQNPPPPQPVPAAPTVDYVVSSPDAPAPAAATAPAAEVVIQSTDQFVAPLSPYGEWVVVGSYGRCWRPLRVEADWRPYCNGYWQRTDAGWFWVSSEPWGWATYHYGRWDWTVNFGWVWVPQTQWAPAWVAWREGGGYIGWAPLTPTATIAVSGGIAFHDAAYAPRGFVFVEERRLLEPVRPRTVIVNNTVVINKTVNITKIQVVNKTVINEGPHPDVIERATGRSVHTVAYHDLRLKEEDRVAVRHPELRREEGAPTPAPHSVATKKPTAQQPNTAARTETSAPVVQHHPEQPIPAAAVPVAVQEPPKPSTPHPDRQVQNPQHTVTAPTRAVEPHAAQAAPVAAAPTVVHHPAPVENVQQPKPATSETAVKHPEHETSEKSKESQAQQHKEHPQEKAADHEPKKAEDLEAQK